MPTRNINLTKHFDEFVEETVASGRYANASEVIRDGLRLLEQKSQEDAVRLRQLSEAADAGFAAIERGEFETVTPNKIRSSIKALGKRATARARRHSK
jgi:antitoxin ParD1/3/4